MADLPVNQTPRRLTREELFALVWQSPMRRLAEEFGISGGRLAKICDRMDVPYPPLGYWAKKAAGKPVLAVELPVLKCKIPETTDIYPTRVEISLPREAETLATTLAAKIGILAIREDLGSLHPRVKAWIAEHKRQQKQHDQDNKLQRHETWWTPRILPDLSVRDLYRFRVTSAIFTGVEKAGGRILRSPITGRATFEIGGHAVECSIVEKLVKSLKHRHETQSWTAYPGHHREGLHSSGFLRVSITTYVAGRQRQWVETQKIKAESLLPEIVGNIMATGQMLEQQEHEIEEREKRYREEEARRCEARRLREIDDKRWNKFREFATKWEQRRELIVFLAEVERRSLDECDVTIGDVALSDWIAWARARIDALDPLNRGAAEMFSAIKKMSQGS